ncbi:hypothetical protein OIU79_018218 [Salix purpurea]|uniref:Uncharacterized protein n=1 Tax=Salix purpurea TaxID=77065 RepID=A0A9Q1AKS6_SALPP|nr:hypothetical protein OIU79_018218 [Salix purpurea]
MLVGVSILLSIVCSSIYLYIGNQKLPMKCGSKVLTFR